MKPQKGFYSLIQYCPDPRKLEVVNVGVVLFCPEVHFLSGMTTSDNSRIVKFFGSSGHDWTQINSIRSGMKERLSTEANGIKSLEELQEFIDRRANKIRITSPRSVRVEAPQATLERLFRDLVGEEAEEPKHKKPLSTKDRLAKLFLRAGVEEKIVKDVRIHVPISDRTINVPFCYQNGRFNLIEPVRFLAGTKTAVQQTAFRCAVEGESIFESKDEQFGRMQLIVVGQFKNNDFDAFGNVKSILDKHHVKLVSEEFADELVDDIATHGKLVEKEKLLY